MSNTTLRRQRVVSDASAQLAIRRRRSRWRAALRIVIGVLVMAMIAGALWLVGFSRTFAAERVIVSGSRVLDAAAVERAAEVPMGTPLARLDLSAIQARVESLRPVASAEVSRSWPHAVRIRVTERSAVIAIKQPEGFVLADADGVTFETVTKVPKGLLTVQADPDDPAVLVALGVVTQALSADLRSKVTSIKAETPDTIELELGHKKVIWGSSAQSALKVEVLTALLPQDAKVYDVSAPGHPATK